MIKGRYVSYLAAILAGAAFGFLMGRHVPYGNTSSTGVEWPEYIDSELAVSRFHFDVLYLLRENKTQDAIEVLEFRECASMVTLPYVVAKAPDREDLVNQFVEFAKMFDGYAKEYGLFEKHPKMPTHRIARKHIEEALAHGTNERGGNGAGSDQSDHGR